MKFGISVKNRFSGAWLSVRLFQVISILPAVYLFVSSGYRAVLQGKNVFSFLFSFGLSALPCGETLGLSALYRITHSEILIHFLLLGLALAVGIVFDLLLRKSKETGLVLRVVMLLVLASDIPLIFIFRIPIFFGTVPVVCGLAVRLVHIVLIVADLFAAKMGRSVPIDEAAENPERKADPQK